LDDGSRLFSFFDPYDLRALPLEPTHAFPKPSTITIEQLALMNDDREQIAAEYPFLPCSISPTALAKSRSGVLLRECLPSICAVAATQRDFRRMTLLARRR
jgi:hypothetical protein